MQNDLLLEHVPYEKLPMVGCVNWSQTQPWQRLHEPLSRYDLQGSAGAEGHSHQNVVQSPLSRTSAVDGVL